MYEITLDELIDKLEELRNDVPGNAIVRIAWQPTYPLYADVSVVIAGTNEVSDPVVYLAGGNETAGYLDGSTTQALRNEGWQ